jgi:hypothetical protein
MPHFRRRLAGVAIDSRPEAKGGVIRKRTEITVEVEEVIYATVDRNQLTRAWCRVCRTEVTMVSPQHASAIARVSVRTINRWVEADRVHFIETPAGMLLLCVNSLINDGSAKGEH